MKNLLLLLLFPISAFAQLNTSASVELGSTGFKNKSLAALIGFSNFQDDRFHAGLLVKDYGAKQRYGARISINLNLSDELFIFVQGDVFANTAKEKNANFLENSAGLGLRLYEGLSIALGYQMEDYNPITTLRAEDQLFAKMSYVFHL